MRFYQNSPKSVPIPPFLLNPDVKNQLVVSFVQLDLTPVPTAHYKLLFPGLPVGFDTEYRHLVILLARKVKLIHMTHTMNSSVCIGCNVLCILVAREETIVITASGLPRIGFNVSRTQKRRHVD